ncbi:MAG: hypothetical protein Q8R50_01180, partial [Sediminibacterium sp.]|nr:hypothetical protein [Sediminibacterium sp.]
LGGSKNPGQNKYIYYFITFPYLPVIYFYFLTGKGGFLRNGVYYLIFVFVKRQTGLKSQS